MDTIKSFLIPEISLKILTLIYSLINNHFWISHWEECQFHLILKGCLYLEVLILFLTYPSYILRENYLTLFQELRIPYLISFSIMWFLSCLGFHRSCTCCHTLCEFIHGDGLLSKMILFHCSHPPPLAPPIFLIPYFAMITEPLEDQV